MTQEFSKIIRDYKRKALGFKTEEDVRLKTNELLRDIAVIWNISLESSHEVTSLHGGRADSIYSNLIFEYKTIGKFDSVKGQKEALNGRDEQDHGLRHYLVNFTLDDETVTDDANFKEVLFQKVGIGFDGKRVIISRYIPSNENHNLFEGIKTKSKSKKVSPEQCADFVYEVIDDLELGFKKIALMLRSTTRKRLSSSNLLSSFGPDALVTKESIKYLYDLLQTSLSSNTKVNVLYQEWNRIFGDVYGDKEKETDFTKYSEDLCLMYDLERSDVNIRKILYVLQTYYNIVLKLLISNLLDSLNNPLGKTEQPKNKNELFGLFSGKKHLNFKIENFFEIHFFEWFVFVENFDNRVIQNLIAEIDNFETTASIIRPEAIEDVLRDTYSNLMPRSLRHLMGEYYTPGWLVDFTLDKAQYLGDKNISLLDPTCGSGVFLTHAIKRYKEKNKENGDEWGIISNATKNIVGYDINPISVISAKTNYILSLGDLSFAKDWITIPIYMCDSVLVPTVHAKQNEFAHAIQINTVVGAFEIPVLRNRQESDFFLKEVSRCVSQDYTYEEFVQLLENEKRISLKEVNEQVLKNFYDKLINLHLSGKNGFWPIILKNSFAPLFAQGSFDIVVGNPPWIGWKSMSDTYRKQTLDIWLSYNIFEKSSYDKITTHDDFAMAVTYVSIDHYVKNGGEVAFILPQTFLKSAKGGEGFRKFRITRDGSDIPFAVTSTYDMTEIQPFREHASNRAALILFRKNKEMLYPMENYFLMTSAGKETVTYKDTLGEAFRKIKMIQQSAKPINDNLRSPWLTLDEKSINIFDRYLGKSPYRGRKGIEPCGAKGIYLLEVNKKESNKVEIQNIIERSRLQKAKELGVHKGIVEMDFIYPMIGGRNIDKWGVNSYLYMIVPHYAEGESVYRGIPESDLKTKYRNTFEWLHYFKDLLLETRIRNGKFFDKDSFPFYKLDNVGPYTFSPYHVVWREQNKKMVACVISNIDDKYLGIKKIVTDSKVLSCPFERKDEAHYLCAIVNSPTISRIIESYTIDTQRGIDILTNIKIPEFNPANKNHMELSALSEESHILYLQSKKEGLPAKEKRIDELVLTIF